MSADSIAQLGQARSGIYSDWHPPIMAWLWSFFDRVLPGPGGLFIVHIGLFWSALILLARFSRLGVGTFLIGVFPPIFALLAPLWKDVGMAIALLVAGTLFLCSKTTSGWKQKLSMGAAFFFLFYAAGVRHNALPALVPIIFYWLPSQKTTRRWIIAGVVTLAVGVLANLFNRYLLGDHRSEIPSQQILLHDLTAFSLKKGENLIPKAYQVLPKLDISELQKLYSTRGVVPLFCCEPGDRRLQLSPDAVNFRDLRAQWQSALVQHPGAYLQHRWRNFRGQMGIENGAVCNPFLESPVEGSGRNAVLSALRALKNSFLFRGIFYLLLSWGLLIFLLRQRIKNELPIALLLSGNFYTLPYFFISTACDFRMHWWLVLSTCVATAIAAPEFWAMTPRATAPSKARRG